MAAAMRQFKKGDFLIVLAGSSIAATVGGVGVYCKDVEKGTPIAGYVTEAIKACREFDDVRVANNARFEERVEERAGEIVVNRGFVEVLPEPPPVV